LPAGANLSADVRRNLAVHAGQQPQHPIKAVYLAGKGAGDLRERLNESLEIPVHIFDPFAGSEARDLPAGNRGTFAGAVGLFWAQAAGQLPINFVAPRQPKPLANPNVRLYRVAAIALVLTVLGLVGVGQVAAGLNNSRAKDLEIQRQARADELTIDKERSKRFKELDALEVPVWGDELYDLTARIADVNALRVTSINLEPVARTANSKVAGR